MATNQQAAEVVIKKYGPHIKTPSDVAWYVGRAESEGLVKYKQRHEVMAIIGKKLWGEPYAEEYGYDAEVEEELERISQRERPLSGSHANCQHENTKAARAKCRRMSKGN